MNRNDRTLHCLGSLVKRACCCVNRDASLVGIRVVLVWASTSQPRDFISCPPVPPSHQPRKDLAPSVELMLLLCLEILASRVLPPCCSRRGRFAFVVCHSSNYAACFLVCDTEHRKRMLSAATKRLLVAKLAV